MSPPSEAPVSTPLPEVEQCLPTRLPHTTSPQVLIITRDFLPVQHSGTLRTEAFVHYLPDFGVDPVMFTSRLEDASITAGLDPVRLEAGTADEQASGVYRVPWAIDGGIPRLLVGLMKRLPIAATAISQIQRQRLVTSLVGPAKESILAQGVSVIYASAMPSETVLLADRLGQETGLPVVADLRDPWSYHPVPAYRHVLDFWLERGLERSVLSRCARVIVNSQATQDLVTNELRIPSEKVRLIRNGYDEREFPQDERPHEPLEPGKFTVLHAGQLSKGNVKPVRMRERIKSWLGFDHDPLEVDFSTRSPRYLLPAVERLIDRHPEIAQDFRLWIVGMNNAQESNAVRNFRYPDCLRIIPRVDSYTATDYVCRADLLLLIQFRYFLRGRDCCMAIPAKLYSYLRAGRRILACVQPSEIAELVEQFKTGTVVDPTNVDAIAEGLLAEYRAWKQNPHGDEAVGDVSCFERKHLTGQLAAVFREIA